PVFLLFYSYDGRRIQPAPVVKKIRPAAHPYVRAQRGSDPAIPTSPLRGQHDHPVCRLRSPDGSRRRILQNRHALDVVGIDVAYISLIGEVVQYDQRGFVRFYGAQPPDTDIGRRLSARVQELYPRSDAVQALQDIRARRTVQQPVVDMHKST